MVDESPGIQNKKLLIVALGLALIVMVLYNLRISQVRRAGKGDTVTLLRYNRDIEAGEKIKESDFDIVRVDKRLVGSLGQVIERSGLEHVLDIGRLNQPVQRGLLAFWPHVTRDSRYNPAGTISKDKVAIALPLDANLIPGDIVSVGDRVNVLGMLSVEGKPFKTYRIIESVVVRTIGGKGSRVYMTPKSRGSIAERGMRMYRSITVEVSPKVSPQLYNVISHTHNGKVWIELCSGKQAIPPTAGQINPELSQLARYAAVRPEGPEGPVEP